MAETSFSRTWCCSILFALLCQCTGPGLGKYKNAVAVSGHHIAIVQP